MNHSTYLFGNFGSGYTQYPEDFTKELFSSCVLDYAKTSISIYREGDLIYYVYIRKLTADDKKYIGIAVLYNGEYIDDLQSLFSVFENCISNIVLKGEIIELDESGEIQAVATKLYYKKVEYEWICPMLDSEIKNKNFSFRRLPVLNYAIGKYSTCSLSEASSSNEVSDAIKSYSIIRVLKNSDYDSHALKGFASKLKKLYSENQELQQSNEDLLSTIKKVERKKKQMGVVVALLMIMFVGFVIFFTTIEEKNYDIMVKNQTIVEQEAVNNSLTEKNIEILKEKTDLVNRNNNLVIKQDSTNQELESLSAKFKHLNERYIKLQQESSSYYTQYIKEINSLKKSNEALEQKINQNAIDLASKTADYKILQNKYDRISKQLNTIEKKYYSTREGKKELSR